MAALAAQRKLQSPATRWETIVCPNCDKTYQVDSNSLGRNGRQVRCTSCRAQWTDVSTAREPYEIGMNPVLSFDFPRKLSIYLNGLPADVKRHSKPSTHAIKSFLIRHGVAEGAVGHANGIKINLSQHRSTEYLWDVVSKVEHPKHPREDLDLLFVAESENHTHIDKIIEDANKLPIVRADLRLMFFRANDPPQLGQFFDRLHRLFQEHRKSQFGDMYLLAGMDMQTLTYSVRKLTIRRQQSNVSPWQEF